MKTPKEGQVAQTQFGLCKITKVDADSKSVRVEHFVDKTPITDFRFCDVHEPDLKNGQIKTILVENKIVAKVSGVFEKRIDVKKESDMPRVIKLFPTYSVVYGFIN